LHFIKLEGSMRPPIAIVFLGTLFVIVSLAVADEVTSDYDRSVNFSKYKTFMWVQEPTMETPFMKDRVVETINTQLKIRGLRPVTSGADMAVGANFATEEKHTWETYYSGGGWGWGSSWSETRERTYEVGTLVVDLFDAESKKLIWEGVAADKLSSKPEKRARDYRKVILKMFREFPPINLRTPIS
jgi:Domain of unknown function (DUF4136)